MASLLERQGRAEQAEQVKSGQVALLETERKRLSFVSGAVEERSAHLVQLSGLLMILLFIATIAWLIAVGVLRWKSNLIPGLNRLASVLCAAPVLLLLSSLALFLGYYPYARSIAQYASLQELQEAFGPFFMGVYGFPDFGAFTEIYLPSMFWPFVWCAAAALLGAGLLLWLRSRAPSDNANAA